MNRKKFFVQINSRNKWRINKKQRGIFNWFRWYGKRYFRWSSTISLGRKRIFDFDTNALNINSANEDLYYLDLVIKEHTKDKELVSHLEKLENNLPVLYVSA